jgi:hypothetical protein
MLHHMRAAALLLYCCCPAAVLLLQVKTVLQQMTSMNPNPTIGLAEAAEMLCKHLGVALVRCVNAVIVLRIHQAQYRSKARRQSK